MKQNENIKENIENLKKEIEKTKQEHLSNMEKIKKINILIKILEIN